MCVVAVLHTGRVAVTVMCNIIAGVPDVDCLGPVHHSYHHHRGVLLCHDLHHLVQVPLSGAGAGDREQRQQGEHVSAQTAVRETQADRSVPLPPLQPTRHCCNVIHCWGLLVGEWEG